MVRARDATVRAVDYDLLSEKDMRDGEPGI